MHFIILSMLALTIYTPTTNTAAAVAHLTKKIHTVSPTIILSQLLRSLDEAHHRKTRLDVLTSQEPTAPKLPLSLAQLCLEYAQLQPQAPSPGILREVAHINIPGATVYKFTLTNNKRMIMATSTAMRCPCFACKKSSGHIQLHEIDPITLTPILLSAFPIGHLGFTITRQTRIAASNNGRYVAFYHRERDRGKSAWLLDLSTGRTQKIGTNITNVTFSSDSSKLAYVCTIDRFRHSLTITTTAAPNDSYTRMHGTHADCRDNLIHIVSRSSSNKYTSLFFNIDSEQPENPCHSVTYPKPTNPANWSAIIAEEYNKIIFPITNPSDSNTTTKSASSSSSSPKPHAIVKKEHRSLPYDGDNGNNYFIKEDTAIWPAWPAFFLCSSTTPGLGLRIPNAENVQYIPEKRMLICQKPIYAPDKEKGIRIFIVDPNLEEVLAKLDPTTRQHLENIAKHLTQQTTPFPSYLFIPPLKDGELSALEKLHKTSPELYDNFVKNVYYTRV